MKKVAVIILNWNGEKLLREFLPSVIATTDSTIADVIGKSTKNVSHEAFVV